MFLSFKVKYPAMFWSMETGFFSSCSCILLITWPKSDVLLSSSDIEEVFRFGRDQGIVVEQEPMADTGLQRGAAVRLKVGRQGRMEEQ